MLKIIGTCLLVIVLVSCSSPKDAAEKTVITALKENMNDPASFDLIKSTCETLTEYETRTKGTRFYDKNLQTVKTARNKSTEPLYIVSLKFRAKNAFGALILKDSTFVYGVEGEKAFIYRFEYEGKSP